MLKKLKNIVKNNRFLFKTAWAIKNKPVDNSVQETINGKGNSIKYPLLKKMKSCIIDIQGDNNTIELGALTKLNHVKIFIKGDFNKMIINEEVSFMRGGELWIEDNNCLISIGKKSSFESVHLAATENNSKIIIGDDCMFAYDIDVRTGDSHSIIDSNTKQRINYAKNVTIGNHVWVAAHCSILKGADIADNCVVATRSVVTKPHHLPGQIIGGSPAKAIKDNVNWDRKRL